MPASWPLQQAGRGAQDVELPMSATGLLSGRVVCWATTNSVVARSLLLCTLIAGAVLSGCSRQESPTPSRHEVSGPLATTQRAVLPGFTPPARATYDEMTRELGVQAGPGVPPEDAESLHELMWTSGYRIKFIRLSAPGEYTINVWGPIPHAASEFRVRRAGPGWELVGETSWVLIS